MGETIQQQLYAAVHASDIDLVRQLLTEHPERVNTPSIGMLWITHAADEHNIEMVQLLIDLGSKINTPENKTENSPLTFAVRSSSVEIIKLLLEHGADTNFGRPLISAMNREEDVLEVIQLLVEYGADVNKILYFQDEEEHPFTALDWATEPDEIEFLQSVGAKESKELLKTSGKKKAVAKVDNTTEVVNYFEQTFGKVERKSLNEIVPSGTPFQIRAIKPGKNEKHLTLFTTGLSSQKLGATKKDSEYSWAELFIQLPADWNYKSKDPQWSWPMMWLRKVAKYAQDNDVTLGGPLTIIANNDPPEPLGAGTNFTSLLLATEKSFIRSDGNQVTIYRVVPLYTDERELEIKEGLPALMRAFDRNNVPFTVDVNRQSVANSSK